MKPLLRPTCSCFIPYSTVHPGCFNFAFARPAGLPGMCCLLAVRANVGVIPVTCPMPDGHWWNPGLAQVLDAVGDLGVRCGGSGCALYPGSAFVSVRRFRRDGRRISDRFLLAAAPSAPRPSSGLRAIKLWSGGVPRTGSPACMPSPTTPDPMPHDEAFPLGRRPIHTIGLPESLVILDGRHR